MGTVSELSEAAWCDGQEELELADLGPVADDCGFCVGTGSCPECGGSGLDEDRRRMENADLIAARAARSALEAKVQAWSERVADQGLAEEMVREISPW